MNANAGATNRRGYLVGIALNVAWHFLGLPYRWGGDDPMAGFDCSGFVIELLKAASVLPRGGDWTAAGLWQHFELYEVEEPYAGCLVFWYGARPSRIIHVEFCIDQEFAIGASGGGSGSLTIEDAIRQNAYIKVRPWKSRDRVRGFIDPFKGAIEDGSL